MSEKEKNVNDVDLENEVRNDDKQENSQEQEMQKLKQELDDITDRYKRILAEFENHKKRSQKERNNLYNSILGDIVELMLPILDNLENAARVETKDEEYKKGVELVLKQFKDTLSSKGVEEIRALGETFDPELHELLVVCRMILKVRRRLCRSIGRANKIGTRVIRHSMVVVAN